jgi:hypothetical protein
MPLTELAARLEANSSAWGTLSGQACIARLHPATNDVEQAFVLDPKSARVHWLSGDLAQVRISYATTPVALAASQGVWNQAFSGAETFQALYLMGHIHARGSAQDLLVLSAALCRLLA